jgi:Arc/MetJ-type ribon-helix-helix transcriptional regulator
MAKVLVSLPKKMLEEVDRLVKGGMYASRSEVLREALRRLLSPYGEGGEEEGAEDFVPEQFSEPAGEEPGWVYS